MGILQQGKDKVLSLFLRQRLAEVLSEFGQVESLDVDSAQKSITVRAYLKGETQTVEVRILGYRIDRRGKTAAFAWDDIVTSREWLNLLLKRFVKKREIEIPEAYAGIAEQLL